MPKSSLSPAMQRYLAIGVSVYGIELLVIYVGQRAGMSGVTAVALAFWTGLVISFLLQKFVTFRDRRTHHTIVIPQVVAFSLLVLWNFGFTILMTHLFQNNIPVVIIRTVALAITTLWNFYLYQTKIFSTRNA